MRTGTPKKQHYRHFNIAPVQGPDDFASMEEVLTRRFNRWKAAQEISQTPGKKPDPAFALLPDLLIVDGGKGQLSRAVSVLEKFELLNKIPVAGLAKQNEEIFTPNQKMPIIQTRHSRGYTSSMVSKRSPPFGDHFPRKQRTKKDGFSLDPFRHWSNP
jgi:excinuclease ABC subunit C